MQPIFPPRAPPAPNWFERNWKWLVPVVCFAGALGLCTFVWGVFHLMKSSDAYRGAVARAEANPTVIGALGRPLTEPFWLTGDITANGESGEARLAFPIEGPRGSATVYVKATKSTGVWHYDQLIVHLPQHGERVDLSDRKTESAK